MKKIKRILIGATIFTVMSMLTACGSDNGNNAADETPIVEDNTMIDEKVPEVTTVPEKDRNDTTGVEGEYNGTVEFDTDGTMNDNAAMDDKNSNTGDNNANDNTVTGELGNSVEDLGNGVSDAVKDVGDAVGNMMDGDNNDNNTNNEANRNER